MSVPPTTTKPKTSRKSVVRRKLYAKLEAHLRINGTGAGNAPSTPSVQLPLPNVPVATRTQVDSLNATSLVSAPEVDSVPAQTPMAGPTDGQPPAPHPIPAPTDAPIPNLHLEQAMANTEKKRKAEGRTAAATSKKQKTATTLAEPTGTITIKNLCMRQWNEQQPGGQGLAADFDVYFKGLSDADKEGFKTEMRVAQAAARKAKTAAKKPSEAPSVN